MSATRLLVLGAVRQHGRAHGYQVRADLEYWGAHEWSNLQPGSIYHALKQMAKQGVLLAHEVAPSAAGGPPRTEYEVTAAGREEFFRLLREALAAYDQKTDVLSAALGFMVDLPRAEVLGLLRERLARLGAWRAAVTEYSAPPGAPRAPGHIGEITHRWVHSADAEADWTRGLIARIEGGAYRFAGEGGDPFAAEPGPGLAPHAT
ncbi:PadR family transcriptional regulator [Streptomyces sp. NBC_01565]|uniref:PadR family transcriptional regulator n=1 Tax=Streptomyces sp. NBC_01565 TaxID=2975881 RepID=UPI0022525260|nr:PadR family transcriptional regulator [Streptomyces sp. NBC_01565]MCX4542145.1 PadR family transcriptional regulator [Streptomyces sp. NBC_01565]